MKEFDLESDEAQCLGKINLEQDTLETGRPVKKLWH